MTIIIDGKEYKVNLMPSQTLSDILAMRPLELELTRFAGHEYYAELPGTPKEVRETTSQLLAGHLYYWGEGNSFVINFEDYDIAPYKSVHLGEIVGGGVVEYLREAGSKIKIWLK